ncbi:MAG: helix-turn-helix domain-containing protein, partial [Alphaproteobacteria bacterium]
MDKLQPRYTVKQLAEIWNCSPRNIYSLVENQRLACIRVGSGKGGIRIKNEHVIAFERANEMGVDSCKQEFQNSSLSGGKSEKNSTSHGEKVVALDG